MKPLTDALRALILQHKGSPKNAQRACMRAGHRVTVGQVREVFWPRKARNVEAEAPGTGATGRCR